MTNERIFPIVQGLEEKNQISKTSNLVKFPGRFLMQ
jgi:hypothetical protein